MFNTKREDVKKWFWRHFDQEKEYAKADRNSAVHIRGEMFVPYPIENHIFYLDKDLQFAIIHDWLSMYHRTSPSPSNFSDFLKEKFGESLYNIYFEPYNRKVWRRDLSCVPLDWLEGKLPMPTVEEMLYNNINHIEEKSFVHSSFYYPQEGGSQFIANRLAEGLNIEYNQPIQNIVENGNSWEINGIQFDYVIYCGNIKDLLKMKIGDILNSYGRYIDELEYHGTTSVFCEIDSNPFSWIYMPSGEHFSHRIICTGNFSPSNNSDWGRTGTIEFTDSISKDEILMQLNLLPFHPKYLTHNFEKYTYPIQDHKTREMITSFNNTLTKKNFTLLGRFALWEYANMDVCIGMALDFYNNFKINRL